MHPAHCPAEPTAEEEIDRDVGSSSNNATLSTRPPRTATAATPARLVADRSYKAPTRSAFTTPDPLTSVHSSPRDQQQHYASGLHAPSPTSPEGLAGNRHADVQTAGVAATTTTTTTTSPRSSFSNAASPNVSTPTIVRGRSGSTTQYRVYQPSSLFGTKDTTSNAAATTPTASSSAAATPAATPAAAAAAGAHATPSSLSSSQLLTDTTHRVATSTLNSDQNGSTQTTHNGDDGADEECERTTSTLQRKSFDVATDTPALNMIALSGARELRDSRRASLRRTSGVSAASGTVTPRTSIEQYINQHNNNTSSSNSSAVRRRPGPTLQAAALMSAAPVVGSAEAAPSAADTRSASCSSSSSSRAPSELSVSPQTRTQTSVAHPAAETEVKGRRGSAGGARPSPSSSSLNIAAHAATAAGSCNTSVMQLAKYNVAATSVDEAGPQLDHGQQQKGRTSPRSGSRVDSDKDGDRDDQAAMQSLAAHVAVPPSVKAVMKNADATKEELWTALRAACQQCELLQRRLLKAERRVSDVAEGEKLNTSDKASADTKPVVKAEDVRLTVSKAPPSVDETTRAAAAKRDETVAEPPFTPTPQGNVRARERLGSTTSTATGASGTSPTSGPYRGTARFSVSSNSADDTAEFRSRIAEVIRRVEATRKGSGAGTASNSSHHTNTTSTSDGPSAQPSSPSCLAQPQNGNNTSNPVNTAADQCTQPSQQPISTTAAKENSGVNVTVKMPEESAASKKKVREAVVKSRDNTDGGRSLTSPLSPASQEPPQQPASAKGSSFRRCGRHESKGEVRHCSSSSRNREDGESVRGADDRRKGEDKAADYGRCDSAARSIYGADDALPREPSTLSDLASTQSDFLSATHNGSNGNVNSRSHRRQNAHSGNGNDRGSGECGNTFTLPSIPSASADTLRKSSFASRSHNSGRLVPIRPPSSSASESAAAAGVLTGSPPQQQQQQQQPYHRRLRAASFASVESTLNGREGSVASSGQPGTSGSEGFGAAAAPSASSPRLLAVNRLHSTNSAVTLTALKGDDAREACRSTTQAGNSTTRKGGEAAAAVAAAQQSNWVTHGTTRNGSPVSPTNGQLPSLHSSSSPTQRALEPLSPLISSGETIRSRALKQTGQSPSRGADVAGLHASTSRTGGRMLSPLPQSHDARRAESAVLSRTSAHSTVSSVSPSILELVRQVAEEDTPVPPPADDKKTELREWRRQAAKMGLRGAPPAC